MTNLYKPKPGSTKSLVRSLYFIIACLAAYIIFGSSISNSEGQSVKDVDPEAALVKGLDLEAEVDEFKKKDDILLKRLKESHDELEAAKLKLAEAEKLSSPQLRGNGAEVKVEVPDTESRKRLAIVNKQVEHLKKEMQSRAKKEAEEKFGPGPHRIKFELDFNPEEMPEGDATSFTIEMAPLDLVSKKHVEGREARGEEERMTVMCHVCTNGMGQVSQSLVLIHTTYLSPIYYFFIRTLLISVHIIDALHGQLFHVTGIPWAFQRLQLPSQRRACCTGRTGAESFKSWTKDAPGLQRCNAAKRGFSRIPS